MLYGKSTHYYIVSNVLLLFSVVTHCEEVMQKAGFLYFYTDPSYAVGSSVAVLCTTPTGQTEFKTRVCVSDGSWDGPDPFCGGKFLL